jgi:hypothetical protein
VVIESVSPDDEISGLEKNPASGAKATAFVQGLYAKASGDSTYDPMLDLSNQLPYLAAPDDGVYVKAKAYTGGSCGYATAVGADCLETFDAVTVVRSLPTDGALGRKTFRPGMAGNVKLWVTTSDVDLGRLPQLAAISPGNYAATVRRWGAPFPSFYTGKNADLGRRWAPKARGLDDYAADRAEQSLVDIYGLLSSDAMTAAKTAAAIAMMQYGLDIYSAYREGVRWVAGAGQGQGYWQAMVFFGALSRDETVRGTIRDATINANTWQDGSGVQFTELHQIRVNVHGVPIWGGQPGRTGQSDGCFGGSFNGHGVYWSNYAGSVLGTGSLKRTCGDPYGFIDGPAERPGTAYAQCCSTGLYVSIGLLMKIWPEFRWTANYEPIREFAERVMDGPGWWVAGDPIAGIDPREQRECRPYTLRDATNTCSYWGVTWGLKPDGNPITIGEARAAGHPTPGPRWSEAAYHLRGRPTLDRERPGYLYWDKLKNVTPKPSAPRILRIQ